MENSPSVFRAIRQVIGLRSYGQKDPLSEFKKEAFTFLKNFGKIKIDVIKFLLNMNLVLTNETKKKTKIEVIKKLEETINVLVVQGKKYKHCCGSV